MRHTVRPGDTATGLAVRYHAWTRELRALNHLGRHGRLYVGERIRIPVVVAALRAHHRHRHHAAKPRTTKHHTRKHHTSKPRHRHARKPVHRAVHPHPWRLADVSQAKVRRVVVKIARRHGVDPHLALAVAWQESGWQQRRISSAGAIGAMQVLPGTATWMSTYVGYELNPYGLYDNVTAGVVLLKFLQRPDQRPQGGRVVLPGAGIGPGPRAVPLHQGLRAQRRVPAAADGAGLEPRLSRARHARPAG